MLKRLLDWITTPRAARQEAAWEPVVTQLDHDQFDRDHGISKAAERYGAANLPRPEDQQADAVEARIHALFSDLVRVLHARATRRLGEYRQTFTPVDPHTLLSEIEQLAARFRGNAEAQMANHSIAVTSLDRDAAQAESELVAFQQRQCITRSLAVPDSRTGLLMLPIALFVADLAFNAFAFAPANEGLRGGLLVASIVAAVNIVVGALLGNWLRCINRRELPMKLLGFICLVLLFTLLPFNLLVAHYRDISLSLADISNISLEQAEAQARNGLDMAQAALLASPLHLSSPQSWGLFILGFAFAAGAAIDGYKYSDPLPGYEPLHNRVVRLRQHHADLHESLNNSMARLRDNAIRDIARIEERLNDAKQRAHDRRQLSTRVANVYRQQAEIYRIAQIALTKRYRQENLLHRADQLTPAAFQKDVDQISIPPLEYSDQDGRAEGDAFELAARQLPANVTQARRNVESVWSDIRSKMTHADAT